ncbi:MAG TPA: ThiF family adenylyltransferase [Gemmatimonadaceae bacterium]|nr:ThiF family adenylyltransferase [Gemmatimonadaceae bacterium]
MLDAPERRVRAVAEVETWIATLPGSHRRLSESELRSYDRKFVQGWRFEVAFQDRLRRLDLLVDGSFPRTPARFALVDRPPFLTWPHVEEDGLLCLLPDDGSVSAQDPVAAVRCLFGAAVQLVQECATGSNEQDLREEFLSYWNRSVDLDASLTASLLNPVGPSREIRVWRGTHATVVAEDAGAVEKWLQNREACERSFVTEFGALLWLPQPLLPSEYPNTAQELLLIARRTAPALAVAMEMKAGSEEPLQVILGSATPRGTCFGAVLVEVPRRGNPFLGRTAKPLSRGFREGRVPPEILARRRFGSTKVSRSTVERADAGWVHGRDQDPRFKVLRERHVVVLGCGAVGAPVAVALAEAGVGRLTLVDPQRLTFANVGRHPLGAEDVPRYKAVALAERLRRRFPHTCGIAGYSRRWEDLSHDKPELLNSADLIVSAMGNWPAEGALNEWHLAAGRRSPIVYAWTEAHACAGHAVLVGRSGGCLRCGLSDHGVPRFEVTRWPDGKTTRAEPGCGATFQPYGPVELGHTTSLAAELALDALIRRLDNSIHRLWAASQDFVASCGGQWSTSWTGLAIPELWRGAVAQQPWSSDARCPDCGEGDAG